SEHHGAGSENLGPEQGEGDAGEDRDEALGHPGPASQPGEDATYAPIADHGAGSENLGPEEGEGDSPEDRDPDQGHPGPASQGDEGDAAYGIPAETGTDEHDDVPEDAAAAGFVADDHEPTDEHPAANNPEDFTAADASDTLVVDDTNQPAEPVEGEQTADEEPQAVMVDVEDYSATTEAPESDTEAAHDAHDGHDGPDSHDTDEDSGDGEGHYSEPEPGEVAGAEEHDRTDEQHGDDEPQAVMVDVEDYSATTEAPESDTEAAHDSHDSHDTDGTDWQHGDEGAQAAMVNVDDFPATTEAHEPDPVEHDGIADGHTADDEPRAEQDHDTEHTESEHRDEVLDTHEDDTTYEQHGDEGVQAAMVDVEDFSATPSESSEAQASEDQGSEHAFEADESTSLEQSAESDADEASEGSEPSRPAVVASPYGPGSVFPDDDGSVPEGYDIKGNAGSMLFHTTESPSYENCVPEVYFESEDAARAAGFAHWDRKRR
ncbi:MAG: hypothetical protein WA880_12150, partial [Ornithinimicrobium sp.]